MIKLEIVRTRSGRTAVCFEAWNSDASQHEKKLIWFDEIDKEMCLTDRLDRVQEVISVLTINQ